MATIYVRSTDGSNSDNGSTWALAKADLTGAAAIDSSGDTIYVSQSHAEYTVASLTLAFAVDSNQVKIICGNDAAQPPTAEASSAAVSSEGNITIIGSYWLYGVAINAGVSVSGSQLLNLGGAGQQTVVLENCALRMQSTGSTASIAANPGNGYIKLKNSTLKFGHVSQKLTSGIGVLEWIGGGVESGSAAVSLLLQTSGSSPGSAHLTCLDLSGCSSSVNLVGVGGGGRANRTILSNCKLPASWSGSLTSGTMARGERVEMHNCDSSGTNYRLWIETYHGSIKSETTIVRTGGASDGVTPLSWKLVSSAAAKFPDGLLETQEIVIWNEDTGSSKTVTVELVTDGVTLTDNECWLEVHYLSASGSPIGSILSDRAADVLGSSTNQTSSSETWTTTGLSSPTKQSLSVSFTPQMKGYVRAIVKLAKASTTVYLDPKLTIA